MTVKELITILNRIPSDVIVVHGYDRFIVDEVLYDPDEHYVTFAGTNEFDEPDDIPDDVDETNYDPYCGCDMYEICGSIDEGW